MKLRVALGFAAGGVVLQAEAAARFLSRSEDPLAGAFEDLGLLEVVNQTGQLTAATASATTATKGAVKQDATLANSTTLAWALFLKPDDASNLPEYTVYVEKCVDEIQALMSVYQPTESAAEVRGLLFSACEAQERSMSAIALNVAAKSYGSCTELAETLATARQAEAKRKDTGYPDVCADRFERVAPEDDDEKAEPTNMVAASKGNATEENRKTARGQESSKKGEDEAGEEEDESTTDGGDAQDDIDEGEDTSIAGREDAQDEVGDGEDASAADREDAEGQVDASEDDVVGADVADDRGGDEDEEEAEDVGGSEASEEDEEEEDDDGGDDDSD